MASRAIGRSGTRFELFSWLFMRVSGVLLLFMAVGHLLWMHYAIGVENLSFQVVAQRWAGPWWRLYDFFLLAFALIHGVNGARVVIDDYITARGWRLFLKTLLALGLGTLLVMGAYIIVTFRVPT